ncbi:hypothetical protein J4458_05130 [Candidatus Woesearchaeota archaeon]|nr:hypothetical protein [Candidatus Woesearchaeota archaeon]
MIQRKENPRERQVFWNLLRSGAKEPLEGKIIPFPIIRGGVDGSPKQESNGHSETYFTLARLTRNPAYNILGAMANAAQYLNMPDEK